MKTQPRQHISNKYNTCTVVTSPVYIGSKSRVSNIRKQWEVLLLFLIPANAEFPEHSTETTSIGANVQVD